MAPMKNPIAIYALFSISNDLRTNTMVKKPMQDVNIDAIT